VALIERIIVLAIFGNPITRYLVAAAFIAATYVGTYFKGRADCRDAFERETQEAIRERAQVEFRALQESLQKYVEDEGAARQRRDDLEEIRRDAESNDSGDECVSADTVERLRALRSR
jgi:uncharacterized membrane protein